MANKHQKPTKTLRNVRFAKAHLAAFALVFAAIGGYFIYQSFAAEPTKNLQRFSDLSGVWNKFRPPPGSDSWSLPSATGTSWPDGGGIFEVSTAKGPGLKFVATDIMKAYPISSPNNNSKLAFAGWGNPPTHNFEGKTQTWEMDLLFPTTGNPTGFPTGWHVGTLFEFPTGPDGGEILALDESGKFRIAVDKGNQLWDFVLGPQVAFDRFIPVRLDVKWSRGLDGYLKWTIDNLVVLERSGPNLFPGENIWNVYFGYYGNLQKRNEVTFAGLRMTEGTPPPPTAPTVSLSANPTSITSGGSSTLSWSSTNATSCSASGAWSGSKITAGTQVVSPTATPTYTLTCTGAGGIANASTTVAIIATPPPPSTFTTSLTQNTTINTPYTWTFNPGEPTVRGQFWADGTLLRTIEGPGPYTYVLQPGTLSSGSHQLGHAWDTTAGIHKTPPSAYGVTITAPSSPPAHIAAADLNNDGTVNVLDLSILLRHYNTTNPAADINGDGQVNVSDLSLLLSRYQ